MPRILLAFTLLLGFYASLEAADERPNIVMIVGDDQAFTDFGFMGSTVVQTPHLDRLASSSVRFPHGYVPSSLCRPSLVSLLTGLYPHQHKVCFNDPPRGSDRRLAERFIREVPTLPRLLAEKGYATFQTGKFWEGNFRNAGFAEGMTHGDPLRRDPHPGLGNLVGRHGDLGLTIGRDGLAPIAQFLDKHQQSPFFLWYAPMLPHTPHNPPAKYKTLYEGKGLHPKLVNYYACCSWFDDTVGNLLELLRKRGRLDNTLILFVVDNGWITNLQPQAKGSKPFAPRSKNSPYEMGLRTPILLHWPARLRPGERRELVSSIDLVPTALAACGENPPPNVAGLNLLPLAEGKARFPRDAVTGAIFHHDASILGEPASDLQHRWIRHENWKLISPVDSKKSDELYNLDDDPNESRNLVGNPDQKNIHIRLRARLDQWWNPTAQ